VIAIGRFATIFVVTDYVGGTNAFDRPFLSRPELPLVNWEELEALQRLGWDIQAHGRRHRPLVRLEAGVLEDEVAGSKQVLERRLGRPVDFLCYPYGAFDLATVAAVRRAGYLGAVTCRPGVLPQQPEQDWCRLPRTLVDGLMSVGHFSAVFRRGVLRLGAVERWFRGRAGADECPFDELDKLDDACHERKSST
jgi:peptidoglycan/xylan/chitin deacetylase (PgdA/CDA1 family)